MSSKGDPHSPPVFTSAHRRFNPLSGDWIIVSPQRICRPWSGHTENTNPSEREGAEDKPRDAVKNPLSPGASRSSGAVNPLYTSTYTFLNDFPALNMDLFDPTEDDQVKRDTVKKNELFAWAPAHGQCSVMCFHPDSDKTLALMTHDEVLRVIQAWCEMTDEYRNSRTGYRWLQIFENRGAAVGSSNMHPHCQVWACGFLPSLVDRYDRNQWNYFIRHKVPLLLDYGRQEDVDFNKPGCRAVLRTEHWLVVVPWWACWPFETMILPRGRHIRWLDELTSAERDSLACVMQQLLVRYDNLFHTEFPYTMGWYQAPMHCSSTNSWCSDQSYQEQEHWQLHALFQPPLLRSASVRKFMSGFELLAEAQRDLLPERAAELLRQVPAVHYTHTSSD